MSRLIKTRFYKPIFLVGLKIPKKAVFYKQTGLTAQSGFISEFMWYSTKLSQMIPYSNNHHIELNSFDLDLNLKAKFSFQ